MFLGTVAVICPQVGHCRLDQVYPLVVASLLANTQINYIELLSILVKSPVRKIFHVNTLDSVMASTMYTFIYLTGADYIYFRSDNGNKKERDHFFKIIY